MTNKQYVVQIRKKGQITLPKDIILQKGSSL